MSSYYESVELKHPTAFRWVAYYFLWFAHLFDPIPIAKPISILFLVLTHLDVLSIPRKWSTEMILAVVSGLYVVFLLFLHRTIFDVSLGELGLSARIPYTLLIFLLFACFDSRLAVERPMLRAGLSVGGALALVSLWFYFQNPSATFFESRRFEVGGTLTGLFANHNSMASAMGAIMVGSFAWWLHKRTIHDVQASMPEMAFLPAIIAAFLLTKSRSFLLASIVVGIYSGFLRRGTSFVVRFWIAILLLVGTVAGIAILATRDQERAGENVDFRLNLYREAAERISMSPFIGLGVGANSERDVHYSFKVPWVVAIRSSGERLREESRKGDVSHTHNMYLQLLLDVGLIGALLLVAFFYAGVQRRNRLMNLVRLESEPNAILNRACLNADLFIHSLVFLLCSGLFTGHTVFGIPCTLILYASMGRMVALSRAIEEAEIGADQSQSEVNALDGAPT